MTVFDHDTLAVENIIADFELSWSAGAPSNIDKHLPRNADPALRQRTLWELVEADLELRIKASQDARVEQYLEDFPSLLTDQARLVEFIHSEYRLRSRRELDLSSESYIQRFPILTEQLQAIFKQRTRGERSTTAATAAVQPGHDSSEAIGQLTAQSGRFRLIEPHDEGGLGKLWRAFDCELNREVALKEIKTKYADDETSRLRFATEAMVTSSLEHPGIVPVYGFGQYKDGRPYYTMRFVHGSSFREAIREFHRADWQSQPAGAHSVEMRRLLGHFLNVCNTIHYAHQRGVLHRDLKPGNIMLGDYGETLVVDWGLAKTTGPIEELSSNALEPIGEARADGIATRLGKALGSPAYMSPEQARGEHDRLGPETDVYSLGATLYTLLTNEAPIRKGDHTEELLESVQHGDWPRPRSIRSNIPVALEAICLKAMALKPEQRYRSARELGVDIERYLADQPVSAQRETLLQQLSRFMRRNDLVVRAIAIALVTVAVTSFVAALLIDEQRRIAEDLAKSESLHRRMALGAKIDAQRYFDRSKRALELLDNAFRLTDDDETGHDVTLVEGLDRAVTQIDKEATPSERGRELLELAKRYNALRAYDRANKYARMGMDLLGESMGPDHPETIEAMKVLADVLEAIGDIDESATLREDILTRVTAGTYDHDPKLVEPVLELASWYQAQNRLVDALTHQQNAWETLKRLHGHEDARTISAQIPLAILYRQTGDEARASELLSDATRICHLGLGDSDSLTLSVIKALSAPNDQDLDTSETSDGSDNPESSPSSGAVEDSPPN